MEEVYLRCLSELYYITSRGTVKSTAFLQRIQISTDPTKPSRVRKDHLPDGESTECLIHM